MKLNSVGVKNAVSLIERGAVDVTSAWDWTTADENKILGDGNWEEYSKWFLAVDEEANEETKARYKFPFGKNGKVYRSGLIAARQRAGQFGYTDVFDEAGKLLEKIDKAEMSEFEAEKWFTIFWAGRHKNKGAKKDWTNEDVEKIYETNKNKKIPLVVSHPPDDLPIIGFAKGLRKRVENGRAVLEAKLEKVSQWLFDKLKENNLNKVSIALDTDLRSIRHIGFVENPAIEGLPAVEFEYVFSINSEEFMSEQVKDLEAKLEEVTKQVSEKEQKIKTLEEKLAEFEAEKKEMLLANKINEVTQGLTPKMSERVAKVIRAIASKVEGVEFEKDEVFETFVEFVKEIPRVTFSNNVAVAQEKNSLEDLEKIVEQYNKEMRWKQ